MRKQTLAPALSLILLLNGSAIAQGPAESLLFEARFSESSLDYGGTWSVEGTGMATIEDGRLVLQEEPDGVGAVLWLQKDWPAGFRLSFDLEFSNNRGIGVFFFAATGPGGEDIFETERTGAYDEYIRGDLNAYGVSLHRYFPDGRNNPGANLRRHAGFHLLSQAMPDPALEAERMYAVEITKYKDWIRVTVDGQVIHEVYDRDPLGEGKIGFRLRGDSSCRMIVDNVLIHAVEPGIRLAHGLLFSESDIPRLRANARLPLFESYWQDQLAVDFEADKNIFREAFIYVITGDRARGESAKRGVLDLVEQEYWNDFVDGDQRLGFLKAGRLTSWMSLAYDWLYELFSEEERAAIRSAIAEKGCVPLNRSLYGFRHPESVVGWSYAPYAPSMPRYDLDMSRWPHILAHNNFRAIINGGLTLGTIVLEGHDDRTDEWKEIVLDSIVLFNNLLKDDGSYDEAVAYLNYAMTFQVHAMESARRKLDVDFFDTANFQGMMDYVLAMYLPSDLYGHGSLTFGDAGNSLRSPTAFWVARHARDGLSQYIGLEFSDHDPLSLLYYDPTVNPQEPGSDGHLVELDLDWIISRSGYESDDFVVGMRSGAPMNHEHGDRNSIQLKAHGEILLADHRRLTYFAQHPEWAWRGSPGHNMVLIDGKGVQYHNGEEGTNESKSDARIVRSGVRHGYHFWASDATQGYRLLNPDVKSVTRTVISFPEYPAIVVLDKVVKESEPSVISTRWHLENSDGLADLTTGDGSFTILRPRARLYGAVAGNVPLRVTAGSFESDNKKFPFRFVDAVSADSLKDAFIVMVGVSLTSAGPDPVVDIRQDGARWNISIAGERGELGLHVVDGGSLPEFEVTY